MIMMMLILIIMITFREESWFVLGCVMAISVLLAGLELVWSLQVKHCNDCDVVVGVDVGRPRACLEPPGITLQCINVMLQLLQLLLFLLFFMLLLMSQLFLLFLWWW